MYVLILSISRSIKYINYSLCLPEKYGRTGFVGCICNQFCLGVLCIGEFVIVVCGN